MAVCILDMQRPGVIASKSNKAPIIEKNHVPGLYASACKERDQMDLTHVGTCRNGYSPYNISYFPGPLLLGNSI
jgi:hypothetical protein